MGTSAGRIGLPEAAQRLGVSWPAAYRLALTGQLEAHKEGRTWVVSGESVERLRRERDGGPEELRPAV